jgi:hypothetical protein
MTEAIREWIIGIAGAALLTAVATAITPESKAKRVVRLICAVTMILALIQPVISFDYSSFSQYTAQFKSDGMAYSQSLEETANSLSRTIIEEECTAYILDKGQSLGIAELSAEVTLKWNTDGYWYPEYVTLSGFGTAQAQQSLMYAIEAELGIPAERQVWSTDDE